MNPSQWRQRRITNGWPPPWEAEEARQRDVTQPPENPTYERILTQVRELDLRSQLWLLEELPALVRKEAGKDIVGRIT